MITVSVSARCGQCDWTAGPSQDWDDIERQTRRHTGPGHPTCTVAIPASEVSETPSTVTKDASGASEA
jgi:hypothetical protein